MIYTYYIPNQWRTKVQSLKPGLTHYVHCGDTYIACTEAQCNEMVALYHTMNQQPAWGLLAQ